MKSGYSMPSVSPLYPEPPYFYKSNKVIRIIFRTTPEVLQELVPIPLLPNPENLAFVYMGEFNVDSPLKASYMEVGIGIPVIYQETIGSFFVYLYLDPAEAIVPGREIWGWPKKNAAISFTAEKGVYRSSVYRDDVELVSAAVNASEQVEPIPTQPNTPVFNLKLIPSVKKHSPPDVMQLTSAVVVSEKRELYRGQATLSFASSPGDDLGKIPILEIINGEQYIEDLSLDCGEVLIDYLAENQQ